MFVHGTATFNKPGSVSWPPTISVETLNSPLATPSTPVCLTLVDASFDFGRHSPKALSEGTLRRHSPKALRPTMILSHDRSVLYGGVGYYHRNCAFRLAFPPLSQSLPKCAILSHPNSIGCTQMPIESYPLYPRPLIACTSNLQRLMAMAGRCYVIHQVVYPPKCLIFLICNNFSLRT